MHVCKYFSLTTGSTLQHNGNPKNSDIPETILNSKIIEQKPCSGQPEASPAHPLKLSGVEPGLYLDGRPPGRLGS